MRSGEVGWGRWRVLRPPSQAETAPPPLRLGSGPINSTFEASKWRRYRAWAGAAGSIATRKAAQARGRSHFGVASRFNRFRSEEHTSELQSLMRISYAVFCLKKKKKINHK